jgi:hypothetical protein
MHAAVQALLPAQSQHSYCLQKTATILSSPQPPLSCTQCTPCPPFCNMQLVQLELELQLQATAELH